MVRTADGDLRGVEHDDIQSWLGVPYAAPPVDDLRWRPPESPEPWDGVRAADEYGPACLQGVPPTAGTTEDCLFLNVHRPDNDAEKLPVMVWIHGGAFREGQSGAPVYNSPAFVQRGVVLVTINYRLGRLGFFAHPALEQDVANFGLLDQVAALRWVQDNITGFGGDPGNVTIFGGSAGGMSVNALMGMPQADGLYDRAISQSGLGRERPRTFVDAETSGELLFPGVDATALRDLDGAEVLQPTFDLLEGDAPILDAVLPANVAETFTNGDEADVPYLVGTTDAEFPDATLQAIGRSPTDFRAAFTGSARSAVEAVYGSAVELDRHLASDALFTEPARLLATSHADDAPTYRFLFTIATPEEVSTVGGARHVAEMPFVFDAVPGTDEVAQELADQIADYWVAFATTGVPAVDGLPQWPTAEDGALLELSVSGPQPVSTDSWDARLDAVQQIYDGLADLG
ncbi:MAG: carboxylesterase family protein [Nocardioides sp.]